MKTPMIFLLTTILFLNTFELLCQEERYLRRTTERNDTVFYDQWHFLGEENKKPSFIGVQGGNQINKVENLKSFLEGELKLNLKGVEIKSKNEIYRSGLFKGNKYFANFIFELDNFGKIISIKSSATTLKSISSDTLKDILFRTAWSAAYKNEQPVNSTFKLRIEFLEDICLDENLAKLKTQLKRGVKILVNQIRDVYYCDVMMYDFDHWKLIKGVESAEKLETAILAIEENIAIKMNQILTKYQNVELPNKKNYCDEYGIEFQKIKKEIFDYLHDEELNQLKKIN